MFPWIIPRLRAHAGFVFQKHSVSATYVACARKRGNNITRTSCVMFPQHSSYEGPDYKTCAFAYACIFPVSDTGDTTAQAQQKENISLSFLCVMLALQRLTRRCLVLMRALMLFLRRSWLNLRLSDPNPDNFPQILSLRKIPKSVGHKNESYWLVQLSVVLVVLNQCISESFDSFFNLSQSWSRNCEHRKNLTSKIITKHH